jgi:hypothetical protein
VIADGAYDGDTVYDEVLHRHPAARVIIPPRSTAVVSEAGMTQRDEHLRSIQQHGRRDRRKFGGASARAVFSRLLSDQRWMRGLDCEAGANRS